MNERVGHFPGRFMTSGNKGKFQIHDPFGVREVVQPIVSISQVEERITGLGTCFQISPWTWLTARHVVMDKEGGIFPRDELGAVGFSPGVVFGTVGFSTPDYFAPITQIATAMSGEDPLPSLGNTSSKIHIDLATIKLDKSKLKQQSLTSPLPISRTPPKIGDEVFGIGFPILGSTVSEAEAPMIFKEGMYGAGGVVTNLHPIGVVSSRPWPTIQVEGDWESGMSGGPVVNMAGEIVGIISSSFPPTEQDAGIGFAVSLAELPIDQFAPEIDRANPGWSKGWATFKDKRMIGFFETAEKAKIHRAASGADEIEAITHCPRTDDWMRL